MSPVEPSSGHATRALLLSAAVIALVVVVLWGASAFITSRHNGRSPSGTIGGVFSAGPADHLLDEIRSANQPLFYPDVSGASRRPVVLSHTGTDPNQGWHAFLALVPGEDSTCVWNWDRAGGRFTASCDPSRHLDTSGDGAGVEHYPVRVDKGTVKIDFSAPVG